MTDLLTPFTKLEAIYRSFKTIWQSFTKHWEDNLVALFETIEYCNRDNQT
jgi:hypothetical protein